MIEAEQIAIEHQRRLLVLDTAEDDGGARFVREDGIPAGRTDPGLRPETAGGLTGTMVYWKGWKAAEPRQPSAIARKSDAFRLAPPTSAPLTSATAINSAALEGFTEPP